MDLSDASEKNRPGIDPGTFRLVAQRLNHYATPGPNYVHLNMLNVCKTALHNFFQLCSDSVTARLGRRTSPCHHRTTKYIHRRQQPIYWSEEQPTTNERHVTAHTEAHHRHPTYQTVQSKLPHHVQLPSTPWFTTRHFTSACSNCQIYRGPTPL